MVTPITMTLCPETGFIIVFHNKNLSIWNIMQLNDKNIKPVRNFQQFEQNFIKKIYVLYENNTLITVASDNTKIWDLSDLFEKTANNSSKFKIKPGY